MNKRVWLITGAGRGMGADIAKAALAAGHAVVATGRNSGAVSKALGQSSDLSPAANSPIRSGSKGDDGRWK
jgi:NAD(P)-dependent dehydrogenase (short-subunit alcohol dehydrogenase family)